MASPKCQSPVPALSTATLPPRPALSSSPIRTRSPIGDRQILPRQTTQIRYGCCGSRGEGTGRAAEFCVAMTPACPTGSPCPPPATMYRMVGSDQYRSLSFWYDTVPGTLTAGDPLAGSTEADVAIVGAGFTGLWTAYYLARHDPGLRIVVCEREIAGFGASGRNGGWCSALFPASLAKLERMAGRSSAIALQRAMHGAEDEVGAVAAAEGIDCHWAKGGALQLARSPAQLERAIDYANESRSYGFGEDDVRLLTAAETAEQVTADR